MKTTLKDCRMVHGRLKRIHGLDEHEKVLYARSLAATPDERWQMNATFLRSLGLWGRSALEKFDSNLMQIDNGKSEILNGEWLPDMDLNHDKQIQSLLCYRYTIGQTDVSERLVGLCPESSRGIAATNRDRRPTPNRKS